MNGTTTALSYCSSHTIRSGFALATIVSWWPAVGATLTGWKVPAQEAHAMVGSEVLKHANSQADMELNNLNEFAIVSNGISEERKIIKDDSHSTSRLHSNHRHGSPGNISWSTKLNPFKRRVIPILPDNRGVSGEYRAGFFSALYFQWMVPLMSVGYQRPLELKDIWNVNPDRGVEGVSKKSNYCWRSEGPHPHIHLPWRCTIHSDPTSWWVVFVSL